MATHFIKMPSVQVEAQNLTSRMQVNRVVTCIELLSQGMVLDLPPRSCALGHKLLINAQLVRDTLTLEIEAIGDVTALETFDDGRIHATIKFTQFDSSSWNSVLDTMDETQLAVDRLMMAVKGIEV